MAESDTTPLTDDERAELEALRAEKARREEAERARRERAELEALRAEQARAEAAETAAPEPATQPAPTPKKKSAPAPAPEPEPEAPAEKTFGVRMVTSDTVDKDGIPTMPMAQKLLIAAAVVGVVAFIVTYML